MTTNVDEADHALELSPLGAELLQRITAHVAATGNDTDGHAVDRTWEIVTEILAPVTLPATSPRGPAMVRNLRRVRHLLKTLGIAIVA